MTGEREGSGGGKERNRQPPNVMYPSWLRLWFRRLQKWDCEVLELASNAAVDHSSVFLKQDLNTCNSCVARRVQIVSACLLRAVTALRITVAAGRLVFDWPARYNDNRIVRILVVAVLYLYTDDLGYNQRFNPVN